MPDKLHLQAYAIAGLVFGLVLSLVGMGIIEYHTGTVPASLAAVAGGCTTGLAAYLLRNGEH